LEDGEDQDENTIDHVAEATSKIEEKIRDICPFYDLLEPVMAERPSATPTYLSEQTTEDTGDDVARALGLENGEEPTNSAHTNDLPASTSVTRPVRQDSPDWDDDPSLWDAPDSQPPNPALNSSLNSPEPSQSQRVSASSSNLATSITTSIGPLSTVAGQKRTSESATAASPRKKSHAETITDRIFPSKEEMDADRAQQLTLSNRRADTEDRLVDATSALAKSLMGADKHPEEQSVILNKSKLEYEITKFDFTQRKLNSAKDLARENRKLDLEVARAQAEVARATAEVQEKESATRNANALMRANMIQGFMQNTGFTYEAAVKATNDVMGPPVRALPSTLADILPSSPANVDQP
jgi:hypothetical protein